MTTSVRTWLISAGRGATAPTRRAATSARVCLVTCQQEGTPSSPTTALNASVMLASHAERRRFSIRNDCILLDFWLVYCCLVAAHHLVHWRGLQRPGGHQRGFNCVLNPGLELKSILTVDLRLSDVDECQSGEEPCGQNSRCHNTNGSFYCTCQRDYIPTSGTRHFHPARDVRCKGQCENSKEHARTVTHFSLLLFFLFLFFLVHFRGRIYHAILRVKVQSGILSCSERKPWCYASATSEVSASQSLSCWNYGNKASNQKVC